MEKQIEKGILFTLQSRINQMDSQWRYLYETHFLTAFEFYKSGASDPTKYQDCISRCNKVFEGVLKKLYDTLLMINKSLSPLPSSKQMPGNIIQVLQADQIFPRYFRVKLDFYRVKIRNVETHQVFQNFQKTDAEESLHYSIMFLFLAYYTNNALLKNHKLQDEDMLNAFIQSFLQTFEIYSEKFRLFNQGKFIYPKEKKNLVPIIKQYYDISPFRDFFTLIENPSIGRLRFDYKIRFEGLDQYIIIFRITESSINFFQRKIEILRRRIDRCKKVNIIPLFIFWNFTPSAESLDCFMSQLFSISIYSINGLNTKEIR